ncbi:enoyl-ACP reductase [Rubrivirga sp. S365]|uniref:Enoyl-[acyl-carrier-protein] reductase [NADH] n=1 Tax=Rubrivirga litoralis TaxID=3075598 RepID=A0ABU3BS34_9BACT|nr:MULTISPECIES: enoyl-ACP reductase [unclassified Rubrivirga]MDT0632089.1 enoyl-ACP reductase [Rubrivirga sp. F394]MDT7856168.1 enoyl-ACP reductase [Rubrivirga sp. S365]
MADTPAGHGLLAGKVGVISGALDPNSIAWALAEAAHREGARFVLTNAPVASRFGQLDELAEKTGGSPIVYADATNDDDLDALFAEAKEHLGGPLDFVVHSIGMGLNVRKGKPYEGLKYEWYLKTLDISAVSLHRMVRAALDGDAMKDGGSVLAMSFIGAQRIFSEYSEMGDAKALLESIVRSLGYRLGRRGIRINAVSQSPTRTTAGGGIGGFDTLFDFAEKVAPLGNADAASCADYCVTLLSDYARMVTMQTLYHDGGFSAMGISDALVEQMGGTVGEDS